MQFFFNSIWKNLHLTGNFYTGTACGACDKYEVWLSHGGTLDMGSTTKNPRKLAKRKKGSFLHFFVSLCKKIQMAANRTILV